MFACTPILEGKNDCEELPVPRVIISLNSIEVQGDKSTGMERLVHLGALREDSPKSRIRGIHLSHKLQLGVRMH